MSEVTYRGACLCGAVQYQISGELQQVAHCHCTMCRRHSGAAFLTYAACRSSDLQFVAELPTAYRSSPQARRGHCRVCGSPLTFVFDAAPELVWLTLGSFEQPEQVRPGGHWFAANSLPWLHLDDGLPRFAEFPP